VTLAAPGRHDFRANTEVVGLCSDLLKINTSNPTHGERAAAEYVAAALSEVGISCEWFEPEPQRTSIVARLPGSDRTLPPLLVHAHLDVVPAVAEDWSVDPFGGLVEDGYVWGRGAVDMKGMVAAMVAVARSYRADGLLPHRDIVMAFFADEEAGGRFGAEHVVGTRPDLFAGCEDAIGEVGGFSHRLSPDRRCYLVSTAEKGALWARLDASGRAGHGSMLNDDNAVSAVCQAVSRIAEHDFPREVSPTVRLFLDRVAELLGVPGGDIDDLMDRLGPLAKMIRASTQDTCNPTSISGGYKANVVPSRAAATVDGRFLPGHEDAFARELHRLAGDRVSVETIFQGPAVESPWDVPLVEHMQRALQREDPEAVIVPYMSTAFTDAKWISRLGIRCYGFSPLLLPDDLDFTALFHGVDERVPVSALHFSVAVLRNLFDEY
jgi:acetylornithine deacetylase/succinyl-diaminopimelate desuccinylase-like protein